jgi:hypothetical protein
MATDYGLDGPGIVRHRPDVDWTHVWYNLHRSHLSAMVKSEWYAVIHDIIPTRQRLAGIHIVEDAYCAGCGAVDSLLHRLYECGQGPVIWTWVKTGIAAFLRAPPAGRLKMTGRVARTTPCGPLNGGAP